MNELLHQYAICINNVNCEDLEPRKVYRVLSDERALQENYIRIIDESGEDYLYPRSYFVSVSLSPAEERDLLQVFDRSS
jgi:hypothetical protein